MNHIYRIVWNHTTGTWAAVAETAKGRGKRSGATVGRSRRPRPAVRRIAAKLLAVSLAFAGTQAWAVDPGALPAGGKVVAGSATISQTANVLTVQQASQRAALNWQSFNIGAAASVNFNQPGASAVALNRIVGNEASQIYGKLNANGQVFFINPNGMLFAQGAQVNVGGMLATTLNIGNADFMAGNYRFTNPGSGSIRNEGLINAAGSVVLLGNDVRNAGAIFATTATLAAGNTVALDLTGDGLIRARVEDAALKATVENSGSLNAASVTLSAGQSRDAINSVVNNTGMVRATGFATVGGEIVLEGGLVKNAGTLAAVNADGSGGSVQVRARDIELAATSVIVASGKAGGGTITLIGDMQSGSVKVAGMLDASAPVSGNGGFIETSAAHVDIASDVKVTTAASMGLAGTWLIDPVDFTIAASGGNMTGAALSASLAGGNVNILSSTGTVGTAGDVNVNDVVAWSANKLTLNAQNNININANLNASSSASLALEYGQEAVAAGNASDYKLAAGALVNLPAGVNKFSTKLGSDGVVRNFTVITSLGAAGSTGTLSDLQGAFFPTSAYNYALGSNIDATATSAWNAGAGFTPLIIFTNTFDGLGHTITNLAVNQTAANSLTGLFASASTGSAIRNVGLVGNSMSGVNYVGGLVGLLAGGTISNSYATGSVSGSSFVGGLVGSSNGTIRNSYALGSVTSSTSFGGLVGGNDGTITNSHYNVDAVSINGSGVFTAGGLYGVQFQDWLNSGKSLNIANYASSLAPGTGGASGYYLIGSVQGLKDMLGFAENATYKYRLTGNIDLTAAPGLYVPSFAGTEFDGAGFTISNLSVNLPYVSSIGMFGFLSSASTIRNLGIVGGSVSGANAVGGLVGFNAGTVSNSYATGSVSGSNDVGGLVGGSAYGTVSNSYATGNVSGTGGRVGGLAGSTYGTVSNSYATGNVSSAGSFVGGLVGYNYGGGTVSNSYATGSVIGVSSTSNYVAGLVGRNNGAVSNSYATGSVTGVNFVGGLVGYNFGGTVGNSYSTGSVIGVSSTSNYVGGLVGYNRGAVSNSYATGSVSGSNYVGGLAGWNWDTSTISNSYATGNVSGIMNHGGGLVGRNNGFVSNSYATGNVSMTGSGAGGLAGYNFGSISNTYSTGSVSGSSNVGGLVGINFASVGSSYWNTTTSGKATSAGGLGRTTAQMMSQANFIGWDIAGTGGSASVWRIYEGATAPLLRSFLTPISLTPVYDGSAQLPANIGDYTASIASPVGANIIGTAPGLSLNSTATPGSYTSAVNGYSSTQQGYDISFASRTITGSGSAANDLSIAAPLAWSAGTLTLNAQNNINVNASLDWSAGKLILNAQSNININANLNASGTASLALLYGQSTASGGTNRVNMTGGAVNLPAGTTNFTTKLGSTGAVKNYTVITSLGAAGSTTAADLQGMNGNPDLNYVLGSNIDATATSAWNGNAGFMPIGTSSGTRFSGEFDGLGHVVSNLTIDRPATNFVGLFGYTGAPSVIRNLGLVGGRVSGANYVGALVGYESGGTVSNSYSTGTVSGSSNVGGLAGYNIGTVGNSHATGSVSGTGDNVGGLVGQISGAGAVSSSYATGAVSGSNYVGGLVGYNSAGAISNVYATGTVAGSNYVGGLAGWSVGTISKSYATGSVGGTSAVGGLAGYNYGTVANSYWNSTVNAPGTVGIGAGTTAGATGLTSTQMRSASSFAGFTFTTTPGASGNNWVNVNASGFLNSSGATYPMLASEYSTTVTNAHQLQLMAMATGARYTLGADIDASSTGNGTDVWGSSGFVPVGRSNASFTGTFDGLGHTISNLSINFPATSYIGLFRIAGTGSVVRNVGLVGGSVSGAGYVGGLVGYNAGGTVSNSYTTLNVSGTGFSIGGLVGGNNSTISNSHATGSVSGGSYVGGLVGTNRSTLSDSYATGSVNGSIGVGGLVGYNNLGTVATSYATGNVTAINAGGGLVGSNAGTVTASHATGSVNAGGYGNAGGLVGWNIGTIGNSYATGSVSTGADGGSGSAGGLVGYSNYSGAISNSYATGSVNAGAHGVVGGLVGTNGGTISNAHATGSVKAGAYGISGGLVGNNEGGAISDSYATGSVAGQDSVGGLVGINSGSIGGSFATGDASGTGNYIGGLVGFNGGLIGTSYATGSVAGASYVGGLAGSNSYGISNSHATGRVTASGAYVGGLVGNNDGGTVVTSHATGDTSGGNFVGGLVGTNGSCWPCNNGSVNDSYATGNVSGVSYVGGLLGYNPTGLGNSYATGNVTGTGSYIGGLIGYNDGRGFSNGAAISNSYATGSVSGATYVGGLVGVTANYGRVSTSYATGAVSGTANVGGLAGSNSGGIVSDSYWNSDATAIGIGNAPGGVNTGATGLSSAQMRTASSFTGFTFTTTPGAAGWVIVNGDGSLNATGAGGGTTPMLASEYATTITNAHQLQLMAMAPAASYSLAASVNASATANGTDVWGSSGFVPIGNAAIQFTGTFDGLGRTVSNLNINQPTADFVGLFGYTGPGSAIRNVGLIGGSVSGHNHVGELVGFGGLSNGGTVSNSYATGSVSGNISIGGLIGSSSGDVSNSYSTGSVSGNISVGGLMGTNYSAISNSYATGSVVGTGNRVGGLVGTNSGTLISNSYATGNLSGAASNIGGLVGATDAGTVSNSYWNTTTSGRATSSGGTGLDTTQMQTASNFAGFNFTATAGATGNNWVMVNGDGSLNTNVAGGTYPMLASEYSTTIINAHQLQLMAMAPAARYTLGTNIDASATSDGKDVWGSGGFVPIGGGGTAGFTGSFDGQGRTVSNLTINLPATDGVGLFGLAGTGAVIQNLGLIAGSVIGRDYVGTLVGFNYGTVRNSYASGSVNGNNAVGGLVGRTYSAISGSHAAGTVSGNYGVGGLVGQQDSGAISNSYATGNVHAGVATGGGLVGFSSGGTISNSYASGNVSGGSDVGGLVGGMAGAISNSYATGNVSGEGNVGGLAGSNTFGTIENSYATGSAIGTASSVGGLVGFNYGGTVSNSFWNTSTSGQADLADGRGTGLNSAQMMQLSSFSSWNAATPNTIAKTGGSGAVWRIYEGHTAPLLTSFMTRLTLADAPDVAVTYSGAAQSGATTATGGVLGAAATGTNAGFYNGYYSTQQGYDITGGNLLINPASLSAISLNGTRAYDGTIDVAASIFALSGLASGENLTLTGVGTLVDKNVGVNKPVSLGSLLLGNGANGLAANYTFTGGIQTATITAANLALSTSNVTKTYDGGLAAAGTATVTGGTLFSGDTLSGGTFAFTDKNAGTGNKTVTASGVTVNDGNSGANYNVSYASNTASTINPYAVNLTGSRGYDGTANVAAGALTIGALVGTETLALSGTGTVADKNVGTAKAVAQGTLALGDGSNGGLAANYTLTGGTQTAAITPASLLLSSANVTKTYDAGVAAAGTVAVSGGTLFTGDTLSGGSFAFTDKNVGSGNKTVTAAGVTVNDGNGGANYSVGYVSNTTSTITAANLAVTGVTASNKVYDATTTATLGGNAVVSAFAGDDVILGGTAGGVFADKNVGTGKAVSVSGNSLSGVDAGNYTLVQPTGLAADITAAPLTLGASAASKTYDGSTTAAVAFTDNRFAGDRISIDYRAGFADRNVGIGKKVSISGLALSGTDALNYSLASPTLASSASITQLASVAWTGGTTGNWSNAANWTAGALPDASNVAAVTIPAGVSVTYDGAVGTTRLTSLTSQGNLILTGGNLTLGNSAADNSRIQNAMLTVSGAQLSLNGSLQADTLRIVAGAVNGSGNLKSADFAQTGGSIAATLSNLGLASPGDMSLTGALGATQSIELGSGGAILDAMPKGTAATVSAPSVQLTAATGIGSASAPLRVSTTALLGKTTKGAIQLENTPDGRVALAGLSTGDASAVFYAQNGRALDVLGLLASQGGAIVIDPPTDVTLNSVIATTGSGSVTIEATNTLLMARSAAVNSGGGAVGIKAGGNITLAAVNAGSGSATIQTSGGQIGSSTPGVNNVTAGDLTLNAATGIQLAYVAPAVHVSNTSGPIALTDSRTGVIAGDPNPAPVTTVADTTGVAQTVATVIQQTVLASTPTAVSIVITPTSTLNPATPSDAGAGSAKSSTPASATQTSAEDKPGEKAEEKSTDKPATHNTVTVGGSTVQKAAELVVKADTPKGRTLMCRAK